MEKEEYQKMIADLRSENWRLHTQCEIIKDIERHHVHEWYHGKLSALKEWARKQPEEICNSIFACLANGSPSVYESPEHSQMLNSLKHALEKAEKEIAALKNREANLHLPTQQGSTPCPNICRKCARKCKASELLSCMEFDPK